MSLEFILHGSGTSSSIPNIACLTSSEAPVCPTCWSTKLPSGRKNHRRNTGALLRIRHPKEDRTPLADPQNPRASPDDDVIVIDAGKTFLTSAQEWFPFYGLRRIAAVILTHAHADAMNGLDDLRGWTLRGQIQETIDVHLSKDTFLEIERSFPYLISVEFATGGGDVPAFKYHIFEDGVPFTVGGGITITPVAVEHGRFFPAALAFTPSTTNKLTPLPVACFPTPSETPIASPRSESPEQIVPYMAYGFVIDALLPPVVGTPSLSEPMSELIPTRVLYFSDVSNIPPSAWSIIERPAPGSSSPTPPHPALIIMDTLRPAPHSSHFGLGHAYDAVKRMLHPPWSDSLQSKPRLDEGKVYLVGFSHQITIAEWECVGEILRGDRSPLEFFRPSIPSAESKSPVGQRKPESTPELKHALPHDPACDDNWRLQDGGVRPGYIRNALEALKERVSCIEKAISLASSSESNDVLPLLDEEDRVWLRPAWDGLRFFVNGTHLYEADPSQSLAHGKAYDSDSF